MNVYAVPLVSPVMVQWVALVDVQVPTACPALLYAVTTYRVSVPPPRLVTAFHSKTTDPLPGVAVSPVGVAGRPYGVAATELLGPSPSDDDDAVTEKLYEVPLVNPVKVQDRAAEGFVARSTTQSVSPAEDTV